VTITVLKNHVILVAVVAHQRNKYYVIFQNGYAAYNAAAYNAPLRALA
jgi:hypothetical protein